jgi:hydroxymethylpyrimidine/phosphomethylpyrimidine kinase
MTPHVGLIGIFCLTKNRLLMYSPPPFDEAQASTQPASVLVFNSNDPCGAGGLSADITAIASVGAHAMPVVTGTYVRDTAEIFDHIGFEEDAVSEQARTLLEDATVNVIKVGFADSPEALSAIAEITSDYPETPVVAYMPNLSWWNEVKIDLYQDAFKELVLPQTTVLVGNHSTLWRWLLPDWGSDKSPTARDIAKAAGEVGVPYTLVTGIPAPEQFIENTLASPQSVMATVKFERFEAIFSGAGDTLSAALAAMLAGGSELTDAFNEATGFLDHALNGGFRPGMGHVIPDRLFWAHPESEDEPSAEQDGDESPSPLSFEMPPHDTQH